MVKMSQYCELLLTYGRIRVPPLRPASGKKQPMALLSRTQARWWYRLWCCIFSGGLLCLSLVHSSQAQITLDGSLGPRGPLSGPHYTIPPDVGQIRGRNLFHSFGHFNIQQGESATF